MKFFSTSDSPSRLTKFPPWLTKEPGFKNLVLDHWDRRPIDHPFESLAKFKASISKAAKIFFSDRKKTQSSDAYCLLTKAITLHRLATCNNIDIDKIKKLTNHEERLKALMPFAGPPKPDDIKDFINDLVYEKNNNDHDTSPNTFSKNDNKHPNMLQQIKFQLPNNRERLRQVRAAAHLPPTSIPAEMATVARGFWSVTWAPRANGPTDEEISNHIQGYTPKIPIDLSPNIPDIDSIINSILATGDSSPGPDGIPFAFYRLFVEEISPVIQDSIVCLARGDPPPNWLQLGHSTSFPQKGFRHNF
jgi:hypothetical protein